jgi:hypothetical protein
MNDNPRVLVLAATRNDVRPGGNAERPTWAQVLDQIQKVFEVGGTVQLISGEHLNGGILEHDILHMTANPGRFRLVLVLMDEPERKRKRRVWWEAGDAPFRGKELFGDDEWDARTVCTDINVAISMFKDFFDARRATPSIIDVTLSSLDVKRE